MRASSLSCLLVVLATMSAAAAPLAPEPCPAPRERSKLVVGTIVVEPFILKRSDGTWGGISIDLWKEVAARMQLDYEIRELPAADLQDPVKLADLDAFVSVNVTAEREAHLDLTHAFYSTGLAIAVTAVPDDSIIATIGALLTTRVAKLILVLFVLLVAVGVVMWLAERRENAAQFGGAAAGLAAGLWWSAGTMTAVRYDDRTPITLLGRVLGLCWRVIAIVFLSIFTAAVASALTVRQLAPSVAGPDDLSKVKVGTVEPSAGTKYLVARRIPFRGYRDAAELVGALATGEVDAVVYEAPILRHHLRAAKRPGLVVLDGTFENHGFAFGLAQCSPLREVFNLTMLQVIASDDWDAILARYLDAP